MENIKRSNSHKIYKTRPTQKCETAGSQHYKNKIRLTPQHNIYLLNDWEEDHLNKM